jgi:hypothetical protein
MLHIFSVICCHGIAWCCCKYGWSTLCIKPYVSLKDQAGRKEGNIATEGFYVIYNYPHWTKMYHNLFRKNTAKTRSYGQVHPSCILFQFFSISVNEG